jgi:GNAT superfamily N-acetyltransferase
MNSFSIRKATLGDLDSLNTIHASVILDRSQLKDVAYQADIQNKGFLLGTDDPHDIAEEISNAHQFLVAEEENKLLGYAIADHREEEQYYDDEYKTWFDLSLKELYYNSPKAMSLSTIATDPSIIKKGVATSLLKSLEEQLLGEEFTHLFSIVSIAPLTNCPSLLWHTRNGFQRLAMGKPRRLFELDNYSAILFYKELK